MKSPLLSGISASRRHQCPSCGVHVKRRAEICVNCGLRLNGEKSQGGSIAARPRPVRG